MSSQVRIPAPLRRLTNGQDKITAEGKPFKKSLTFVNKIFLLSKVESVMKMAKSEIL